MTKETDDLLNHPDVIKVIKGTHGDRASSDP